MELSTRNSNIDGIKILATIAVVAIHVMIYTEELSWYRPFLDLAVPLFFMITGYFIGHRSDEYLKQYNKKTVKIYLKTSLFYILVGVIGYSLQQEGSLTIDSLLNYLRTNHFRVAYIVSGGVGKYHLWYLFSLVIGVGIYKWLRRYLTLEWIIVISIILSIMYINSVIYVDTGGIPKALLFITIGQLMRQKVKTTNKKLKIILIIPNSLLAIASLYIYFNTEQGLLYWVINGMMAVIVFHFCLTTSIRSNRVIQRLANHTTTIYILHVFVIEVYILMLKVFNISINGELFMFMGVVVVVTVSVWMSQGLKKVNGLLHAI